LKLQKNAAVLLRNGPLSVGLNMLHRFERT
jgi:hypothetical protein